MVVCSHMGKVMNMSIALSTALAASLSLAGASPSMSHAAKTGPDAFMPVPVTSVQALVHQVETNQSVRHRYALQLHVPESRVAAYLQANLVKSHLQKSARYTMYCLRPNGLVYPALTTVTKGSTVFALRGGPAVISYPDGNPLVHFRPVVITRLVASHQKGAVVNVSPSQEMIAPMQGQEIVVPAYIPVTVYQSTSSLSPDQTGAAPVPPAPPATP